MYRRVRVCTFLSECVCRNETERETGEQDGKKRLTTGYGPCPFLYTPPSIVSASALLGHIHTHSQCKYSAVLQSGYLF